MLDTGGRAGYNESGSPENRKILHRFYNTAVTDITSGRYNNGSKEKSDDFLFGR